MGRHDIGGPDEAGGAADLGAIVADDALLDALGRHHRPARSAAGSTPLAQPSNKGGDGVNAAVPPAATDSALTDLFATWRADLDAEPVPAPPSVDSVVLALRRTARRRSLRPILGVAVAICALLVGSATIGARTARPGDVLWPVTQVLWSDRAESVVAGDTTRVALGQARMALDSGLTIEARSALVVASTVLPRVAERDGRQNLKADLDNLWSTLDWVQQQHTATVSAAAPAAPPPTWQPDPGAAVETDTSSPSTSAGSSSLPGTSTACRGRVVATDCLLGRIKHPAEYRAGAHFGSVAAGTAVLDPAVGDLADPPDPDGADRSDRAVHAGIDDRADHERAVVTRTVIRHLDRAEYGR